MLNIKLNAINLYQNWRKKKQDAIKFMVMEAKLVVMLAKFLVMKAKLVVMLAKLMVMEIK